MNIEEAIKTIDKFVTEHKLFNIKHSDGLEEAIEILLTAYGKEKEKNKEARYYIIDRLNSDDITNLCVGIDDMKIILDMLEE